MTHLLGRVADSRGDKAGDPVKVISGQIASGFTQRQNGLGWRLVLLVGHFYSRWSVERNENTRKKPTKKKMAAFHSTLGRPASFGTLGFHLVVNFRKTHPFSIRQVIARTIHVIALLMTKPTL